MMRYWIYRNERLVGARAMSHPTAARLRTAGYQLYLVSGEG